MSDINAFSKNAAGLARNPLGIIALFIVLVYGFASLVCIFGNKFAQEDKVLLIYFLIIYPILVLFTFLFLVVKHSNKLFGPSDFRNEENFLTLQLSAAASLGAATAKDNSDVSPAMIERIAGQIAKFAGPIESKSARNHILWVDDRPENNIYERQAFESFGLYFTLAKSTDQALKLIGYNNFAAIISDMGRAEGPREGYKLLDQLRLSGNKTPLFFYASSNAPEHKIETTQHGGQGCTNNAQELFEMVMRAVVQG